MRGDLCVWVSGRSVVSVNDEEGLAAVHRAREELAKVGILLRITVMKGRRKPRKKRRGG